MSNDQLPYLTAEELRHDRQEEIAGHLGACEGHMVRSGLGLEMVRDAGARHLGGALEEKKLLDCGSASGKFLTDLAAGGMTQLYATDLDNYLTPDARGAVREFRAADFSHDALGWPDGFFDLATAWCIVPHLENPYHFGREIARVLKPGGVFLLSMPNIRSRSERRQYLTRGNFARYSRTNNHIFVVTSDVLDKMMAKNGMTRVSTRYRVPPAIFSGAMGLARKAYAGVSRMLGREWEHEYGVVTAAAYRKAA